MSTRKRPPSSPATFLLALFAFVSCSRQQTELVVVVDTDLAVPQSLDAVDIDVTGPSMGQPVHAHASLSGAGASSIPVSLSLIPASTDRLTPVLIVVTGRHGTDSVVTRTVRTGFLLNQQRTVAIVLQRVCMGVSCTGDSTCAGSMCVSPTIDPAALPPFTGSVNPLDAGHHDACVSHPETCNGVDDDCDGVIDNGFNLQSDMNNCGSCGHVCALSHATGNACMAGACQPIACQNGFGDCDMTASNGCETPLNTLTDCGTCHTACARDHATPTCATGMCAISSCSTGFDNCDGSDANGCEAALDQLDNCGACMMTCARANATPTCSGRACAIGTCQSGFGNCDSVDTNGCETPLNTPSHCLMCGRSCSYSHATSVCGSTGCSMGACDANFGDCDGLASTGCEAALATSITNCGRCGHACGSGIACTNAVCDNERLAEVAGGAQHTCARRVLGGVFCWGANDSGQLGDGSTTQRSLPTAVSGMTDADSLATGDSHTCVHRGGPSGTVQCWGQNTYGQLGNGSTAMSSVPVTATGVTNAAQVTAGGGHTCARLNTGLVRCWGLNTNGQLGDGTTVPRSASVAVMSVTTAASIAAGSAHTCARLGNSSVQCWGLNTNGQLGDGTHTDRLSPVLVSGLPDATAIAAGDNHTCAVHGTGSVVCWGDNTYGQLGDGTTMPRATPTAVVGLTDAVEVTAGQSHTCARRMTGDVVCWGYNFVGQLGDGTNSNRLVPTPVSPALAATVIAAGSAHSCAMNASSVISCWGGNTSGQLGNGAMAVSQLSPVTVVNLP